MGKFIKINRTVPFIAIIFAAMIIAVTLIEAAEELRMSPSCPLINSRVVKQVKIPRWYHEGMFYDGKFLWLANGMKGCVWVLDPDTGQLQSSIEPVSTFCEAVIRRDDGALFTTEWDDRRLYRVRLRDNKLIPEADVSFALAQPAGLAWNGERFFIVTWTRLIGVKFNLIELDREMNKLSSREIKCIEEPDQLTWDGKYLWISSWCDQRVYKVDINSYEVVGYFNSPAKKATGIAWDGKYMWVTGTYDDLYKIEIIN